MAGEDIKLTKLAKCAGCGAKVGAGVLAQLLGGLKVHSDPRLLVGFDKHRADRLTVLDVCRVTARTSHNDDFQNLFHILFQLLIDHSGIHGREVAQKNTFRSASI